MNRYRKKPVVIEAVQLDGTVETSNTVLGWIGGNGGNAVREGVSMNYGLTISTLEGLMKAQAGDWIIKGVRGEFYPCKPDIFDATYEVAE